MVLHLIYFFVDIIIYICWKIFKFLFHIIHMPPENIHLVIRLIQPIQYSIKIASQIINLRPKQIQLKLKILESLLSILKFFIYTQILLLQGHLEFIKRISCLFYLSKFLLQVLEHTIISKLCLLNNNKIFFDSFKLLTNRHNNFIQMLSNWTVNDKSINILSILGILGFYDITDAHSFFVKHQPFRVVFFQLF